MVLDQDGVLQYSGESADIGAITRKIDALLLSPIEKPERSVQHFELFENYPNPFNPSTAISYQLSAVSDVQLSVFNVLGQKVRTLVNERQAAGNHSVIFNASGLASGVYVYKLSTENGLIQTRRMILMR